MKEILLNFVRNHTHEPVFKRKRPENQASSCEEKDRTSDLRVMSPTSYRCSTSRCKNKRLCCCSQNLYFSSSIIHAYMKHFNIFLIAFLMMLAGCKGSVKERSDDIQWSSLQPGTTLTKIYSFFCKLFVYVRLYSFLCAAF